MIIGIGTDLVSIGRFRNMISKYGHDRIAHRLFHPLEVAQCPQDPSQHAQYYASRWAVKEAMIKAIGRGGFSSRSLFLEKKIGNVPSVSREANRDTILPDLPSVKLSVSLEPGSPIERYLHMLLGRPPVPMWRAHVSLSHEDNEYAMAFVILESLAQQQKDE